jgi:hypothetical protein
MVSLLYLYKVILITLSNLKNSLKTIIIYYNVVNKTYVFMYLFVALFNIWEWFV